MKKTILIRCDAAPAIGFGHVVRCLALADELRGHHDWQVEFAMVQGPQGVAQVREKGYWVHQPLALLQSGNDEGEWLQAVATRTQARVLMLDVRTELIAEAVQAIRKQGVLIVTLDDPSERRLAADLAFYPPVPQVERLDWTGFSGRRFVGWDWIPLRREFAHARKLVKQRPIRQLGSQLRILVTMGGSDPAGLTLLVLKALDSLTGELDVQVVLGGGFMHEKVLNEWLVTVRRTYTIEHDVDDMTTLMMQSDMAVASFGVTAYELAVMGVPAVYLCLTPDHAESASALMNAGIAVSLGDYQHLRKKELIGTIVKLLSDVPIRQRMSRRSRENIDGLGAERIARQMISTFSLS